MCAQIGTFLMLGPSQLLNLPNELGLSIAGLVLSAMTFPFTIVCAYQELYDAVTEAGKNYDPSYLNDVLVGMFNSFFSLGLIIGPLASSYVAIATSFR